MTDFHESNSILQFKHNNDAPISGNPKGIQRGKFTGKTFCVE